MLLNDYAVGLNELQLGLENNGFYAMMEEYNQAKASDSHAQPKVLSYHAYPLWRAFIEAHIRFDSLEIVTTPLNEATVRAHYNQLHYRTAYLAYCFQWTLGALRDGKLEFRAPRPKN